MKILHTVEFYYPSVGGAQEVVRQLSERLVKLGHDVTVATTQLTERKARMHNGVKIAEFDVHGKEAYGYSGKDIEKYKSFVSDPSFDVVMNYAAQQWATDLAFEVLDKIHGRKILVPCGFSGLYDADFKDYFKRLPAIMKKYDASVYLSDDYRDINFARQHEIKNLHVIPNGAGADEFDKDYGVNIRQLLRIPKDHFLSLLVGSHTNHKGHKEAIEIFKGANIRNATLLINANDLGGGCAAWCKSQARRLHFSPALRLAKKQVLIKDLPLAEKVEAYKSSDLFLFPSNIEASPLVLFEAMAASLPFLTTDVGNSKEIIEWSGGGELLPTTKDDLGYSHAEITGSIKKFEEMYNNKGRREQLAKDGHAAWRKNFSWEIITKRYEQLYAAKKGPK